MASEKMNFPRGWPLLVLIPGLFLGGCLFDSLDGHALAVSNSSTQTLDTIYPASAQAMKHVSLYEPILDNSLGAGAVSAPEVSAPVNVKEHASGQVVQYTLTRQRFGSWSRDLEFKWNYFELKSNFFFPDSIPDTAGMADETKSLYDSIHKTDHFTNYFDSAAAPAIWNRITSSKKPGAMGLEVHINASGDTVSIRRVVAGSPAAGAGLVPGLQVLAVNDSAVTGDSALDRFSAFAAGDSGTPVTLTLLGPQGAFHATMTRAPVAFPTVDADSIDGVGYISVAAFTLETVADKNTYLEFKDALTATRRFPVTIIDLRDNPGGVLDLSLRMCDEIIPQGPIIINEQQRIFSETRRAPLLSVQTFYATSGGIGENLPDGTPRKYLVLANGGTASAAEIFLVAAKEDLSAPQMGTRSYGKGVGQIPMNTPGKGLALVTFLHFISRTGLDYHKKGLEPDIPDSSSSDSLLAHAVDRARNMQGTALPKRSAQERMQIFRRAQAVDWNRRQRIRRGPLELDLTPFRD